MRIVMRIAIAMSVITCWLLGSFEALPASAFEHGQQDKQPSCRSLIVMTMIMVSITRVMISMMIMAMMAMMTVKRRRRMVMPFHGQQDKQSSCECNDCGIIFEADVKVM